MIQTEEVNAHAIISKNFFKEKKLYNILENQHLLKSNNHVFYGLAFHFEYSFEITMKSCLSCGVLLFIPIASEMPPEFCN